VGGKSAQPILVRKNSKKDQSNIVSDLSNFPRSEIKLTKMLMDKPAPPVSAWTWVILDRKSKKVLFGRLEKDRREVASLTKIMTLYTVLSIVDALKISLSTQVEITQTASEVIGTSACLVAGDTLTLNELLYGMMLPSGNDAAHMLASYLGSVLLEHYEANKMTREQIENYTISGVPVDHNQ
jgi:D-alanyl-D-alanine carboxypeptidase